MSRAGQLFPEPIAGPSNAATTSGNLTTNVLVVGAGANAITSLGSTGNSTTVLHGSSTGLPSYSVVVENDLSLSNVTTWDVTTLRHGFCPVLPNNASKFLDGTGAFTTPAGSGGNGVTSSSNVTITNNFALWASTTGSSIQDINLSFSTDGTFASPSNLAVPTTQAVVTYIAKKSIVLLEEHTANNVATLDFTSSISTNYDDYEIHFINIIPVSNNVSFQMRMGAGSFDSSSIYNYGLLYSGIGDVPTQASGTNVSSIDLAHNISTTTSYSTNGVIWLANPASTGFKFINGKTQSVAVSNMYQWGNSGVYKSTSSVDRFQFFMSSGNVSSGTIRTYGVPK